MVLDGSGAVRELEIHRPQGSWGVRISRPPPLNQALAARAGTVSELPERPGPERPTDSRIRCGSGAVSGRAWASEDRARAGGRSGQKPRATRRLCAAIIREAF